MISAVRTLSPIVSLEWILPAKGYRSRGHGWRPYYGMEEGWNATRRSLESHYILLEGTRYWKVILSILNVWPRQNYRPDRLFEQSAGSIWVGPTNLLMWANTIRRSIRPRTAPARHFSLISVHTKFPASLYRFQVERKSKLQKQQDTEVEDALILDNDGLVYPGIFDELCLSNGAVFMPNTFTMQEILRASYDYYIDGLEDGDPPLKPMVIRIHKGTEIPSLLTLFRERSSRFSLQPSQPVTTNELNDLLDDFYSRNATFTDSEEWQLKNEYDQAADDNAVEEWMSQ